MEEHNAQKNKTEMKNIQKANIAQILAFLKVDRIQKSVTCQSCPNSSSSLQSKAFPFYLKPIFYFSYSYPNRIRPASVSSVILCTIATT